MQTNINQSKVYQDNYRKARFKEAYGIDCDIYTQNFTDEKCNWIKVILQFIHRDNKYTLTEHFNDGDDNSTKEVFLDNMVFNRFLDAELKLVELIKENNGNP